MKKHNMIFSICVCLFVAGVLVFKSVHIEGVPERSAHAAVGAASSATAEVKKAAAPLVEKRPQALIKSVYNAPKAMLSLSATDVFDIFGASDFVRADLPVVIWQYGTEYCVMDIYFKASAENDLGRIVHYEMRSPLKEKGVEESTCLKDVLRHHARPQSFGLASMF